MTKRKAAPHRLFAFAFAASVVIAGGVTLGPDAVRPAMAAPVAPALAPVPGNAPFASEINAFAKADQKQMPPTGAVLFIGSSSIRLWDTLAKDFPEIPVINRGFGGSFIQDSTRYADRIVIPYKPKMIVLGAGTNDVASNSKTPQQVFQDYKDFVAKVHEALPDTRIIYLSINPTVARWKLESEILETNHLIEDYAIKNNSKTLKLNFINAHPQLLTPDGQPQPKLLRSDGLHFNADGYQVWTSIVKPRILALAALDGVERLDAPKAK
jgi:lysophospholipase L1-like esterase